ncbi:growth-regulating factor 4-like [Primulina huaijiensis]|uniref:growth-regulating factor 4-like n=1 Tax=Primulina huaijiensis TaxID=1492673 RepID=UPI003CC74F90
MSGTASGSVVVGGGVGEVGYGGYNKPPFTAVQWQELEHQAMIYKYLVAGLPIPPDLVMPIRRSFDALASRLFHYPSLGYCSYYGKKFDPEPGRCRRTDGKKWRCSKDAHPDSKYCERHMHRGRNRSRKHVESQSTSQSLSTAISHISAGSNSSSGSFPNMSLYSVGNSEGSALGRNVKKLQMEPLSYGIHNKDLRYYLHGSTSHSDDHIFSPEASLGLGSSAGSGTWCYLPSQVCSSSSLRQNSDSQFLGHSFSQQNMSRAFETVTNDTMAKQREQHRVFGNELCSLGPNKQEHQNLVHPFFSEWPTTKESWSNLDDEDGSEKNVFFSTQLSISISRANSEFSPRSSYSPNDA